MTTRHRDVIQLVSSECNSFAERFFAEHRRFFEDLASGEAGAAEQKAEWYEIYKRFEAESELTMQNALMLWGAVQAKTFEREFIEAAMQSDALNDYLSLTDYPMFIKRMWREVQAKRERDAKMGEDMVASPKYRKPSKRPMTPMEDTVVKDRLSQLDQRLLEIEHERNALLLERRHLVGRDVEPDTSESLKREINLQRYEGASGSRFLAQSPECGHTEIRKSKKGCSGCAISLRAADAPGFQNSRLLIFYEYVLHTPFMQKLVLASKDRRPSFNLTHVNLQLRRLSGVSARRTPSVRIDCNADRPEWASVAAPKTLSLGVTMVVGSPPDIRRLGGNELFRQMLQDHRVKGCRVVFQENDLLGAPSLDMSWMQLECDVCLQQILAQSACGPRNLLRRSQRADNAAMAPPENESAKLPSTLHPIVLFMLGDLAFIFTKYEGREEELFSQVCLKYGVDSTELTAGEPSQAELEEDELVDAIIQLEAGVQRRAWLVRRKREEAKELVLLISLGQERRHCHGCDMGLCRSQRLVRSAGEVCWAVAEEQRCAAEEAASSPTSKREELQDDLRRGRQWLLRELRAILLIVVQEDPRFAELADYLTEGGES
ncbi:PFOR [Symbiodinium necroappetens]|uniref:PFOR protein n=1 Tax=Symbiodinium necroappetens TaxID=1628268 RepID=A0A813C324_9DINO|nr:PFOR [Symbiodinium necroappetens]